ncbi:Clp protease N-terminal domain-containing protein [Streptomyces sp. NPDC006551]|uniref:Clp protease N-terminal domain-containing protein n=1 Tax=Streptomyces sp. NPDC006551 TaxID=3157178 RepID=UPI0033B4A794
MPPQSPIRRRADIASGLTAELAAVVAGARRRALRDGDRQIDTAHLLHSLIESDPEVGAAFEDASQRARLLGYLVQRSIGYGLRWQGSVEETGGGHVVRRVEPANATDHVTGREGVVDAARWPEVGAAGWSAPAPAGVAGWSAPAAAGVAAWSPSAAAAMASAFERAASRGEPCARGLDLLAAVAADPGSRAVEVLRRARVDPLALADRIGELSQQV